MEELLKESILESFAATRKTMEMKTEGPDADMIASEISGTGNRSHSIKYQQVKDELSDAINESVGSDLQSERANSLTQKHNDEKKMSARKRNSENEVKKLFFKHNDASQRVHRLD